jgi:hypothetical protein
MSTEDKILLDQVLEKLDYEVCKDMLVKPLPDEYIEKEIVKPVDTGMKDTDGYTMSDTETVKETVLTTFKKGIVLRIPSNYTWMDANNHPEVGDIVAYPRKSAIDFDLFKDSQLVNPYNIVAFIKKQN